MRKLFTPPIFLLFLSILIFISCKREIFQDPLKNEIAPIVTKADAVKNTEQFFTLINNISNYPNEDLKNKFYTNTATDLELQKFSKDLGFASINDLRLQMMALGSNIGLMKQKFPEMFAKDSGKAEIAKIARETFARDNFKKYYKTTFHVKSPYKTNEEELSKKKNRNPINTSDGNINPPELLLAAPCCCCPCTEVYNSSMSAAFWTASVGAVGCTALFFTGVGALGSGICMAGVTAIYEIAKNAAMDQWEICTSGSTY